MRRGKPPAILDEPLDIFKAICYTCGRMISTRQAAKQLGLDATTLSRYIASKKVPAPKTMTLGSMLVHDWSERDIERVRKLLPKIKNGRKTRYKKAKATSKKK